MGAATDFWIPLEMWTERHPLLRAFGDVLAFWLLFGGVALASYTSHFAQEIGSTLLGLLAVFFTRSYAGVILAVRLDDRRPPEAEKLPNAALTIYVLIGLSLVVAIAAQGARYTNAAILVFVALAGGCRVLFSAWTRQIKPETPKAGDIVYNWFDSLVVGHFAFLFGGVVLAAYTSGFAGLIISALLGWLAVFFARCYVRAIPPTQRLIDRLRPPAHDAEKSDLLPAWALATYAVIGLALVAAIIAQGGAYDTAPLVFVAWTSGCRVLDYLWKRQTDPETPNALDAFNDRLDTLVAGHEAIFGILCALFGFVLLSGGVAVYAWQSGVTLITAEICGAACQSTPGFTIAAAAACGAAAILFVALYTRATLAAQRVFIDPWQYVRPEPKPESAAKWVVAVHVLLGFVLLFVMTGVGQMQIPHKLQVDGDGPESAGLLLGWWIGGRIVLGFFWARWRRGETVVRRIATPRAS
jgi:hypothetical protein